jgi:hypothetical protein
VLESELTLYCSASGGCVFEREISKGNDDKLFYLTSSNATFTFKISPEAAGLSVIMFANCYNNYLGVSYSVSFDIENPGGVRVSAGACNMFNCAALVSFTPLQVTLHCLPFFLHLHVPWLQLPSLGRASCRETLRMLWAYIESWELSSSSKLFGSVWRHFTGTC